MSDERRADDDTAPQPVLRFDDIPDVSADSHPEQPTSATPHDHHRDTPLLHHGRPGGDEPQPVLQVRPGDVLPSDEPQGRTRWAWVAAGITAAVAVGAAVSGYAVVQRAAASPKPEQTITLPQIAGSDVAAPLPEESDTPRAGQTTLVLGDSLSLDVYPYLADLVPDRYVQYVGMVGSSTSWAHQQLEAMKAAGTKIPRVVIISAGTNDFETEAFRTEASAVLDLLGDRRCIAWATIDRPDVVNGQTVATAQELNDVLNELAATHPNLRLIDWARAAQAHPEWMVGDGIHPSEAGAEFRAGMFADASTACSPLDPEADPADRQYIDPGVFQGIGVATPAP